MTMASSRPIYSTVIPDPKDWADAGFLVPHEAIRTMLVGMRKASTTADNMASFAAWYDKYFFQTVRTLYLSLVYTSD